MVVHWLRLPSLNAGGLGLIPGHGTRSHMPQLSVHMLQLISKIPHAATKTQYSQKKEIYFLKTVDQRIRMPEFISQLKHLLVEILALLGSSCVTSNELHIIPLVLHFLHLYSGDKTYCIRGTN